MELKDLVLCLENTVVWPYLGPVKLRLHFYNLFLEDLS
jgi:hypothetical protein